MDIIVTEDINQRELTRLIAQAGYMLLQNGVESKVVSDIAKRFGLALGAESVDIALTASAIIITTRERGKCITTIRQCIHYQLNMHIVSEIQKLCISAEQEGLDIHEVHRRLNTINPPRYDRRLIVVMIGFSCMAFCHLAGGSVTMCAVSFVASAVGMLIRQILTRHAFNGLLVFCVAAFVTSLISGFSLFFVPQESAFLAMASSVLMLVPGFPLINAVSDMLKGYVTMGIARWTTATLLTLATSMGIVGAMQLLGVWVWK